LDVTNFNRNLQEENKVELSPLAVYNTAVKAVPSIKYAIGVAGVIAAAMIAYNLSSEDPRKAVLGFIFALAGMYLLLIFASAGRVGAIVRGPVVLIVWALTLMFIACLLLTLSAYAIGAPAGWAKLVGAVPADSRVTTAEGPPASSTAAAASAAAPGATTSRPSNAAASATVPAARPAAPIPLQETFRLSDSSNDCGANQTRALEYCLAAGARVLDWAGPNIESANCGSNISNVRRVPGRENCIVADVALRGCGYDNILGIKNCRGRGWISGNIVINGQVQGG
jgi:hypothetical protein